MYKLYWGNGIPHKNLIHDVLMIQAWNPEFALSFNYPGWSLSVECFFYIAFPFLFNHIYKKKPFNWVLVFSLILWGATQLFIHAFIELGYYQPSPDLSHYFLYFFPGLHVNEFIIGNVAGLFYLNFLTKKQLNIDWLVLVLMCVLCLALVWPSQLMFHNGLYAVIFGPLILAISVNKGFITKVFEQKGLVLLGEISFGIYILQYPVFDFVTQYLLSVGVEDKMLIFYITLIVLVMVSTLSFFFIESPLRKYINGLGKNKKFV